MHDVGTPTRVVGLAGSLRKASYSRATLLGIRDNLPAAAKLEICDLQLSLYNEDKDGADTPDDVRMFRNAIGVSDGVVIVTPEYNHGIPGVLKNALDWASRPYGRSVLIDKPVLVACLHRWRAGAGPGQREASLDPGPHPGRTTSRHRRRR